MPTESELRQRLWKSIQSDMTMMLGIDGMEAAHPRPMTAQLRKSDGEKGPLYFFTSVENNLVENIAAGERAIAMFASKGHDIFATLHGRLALEQSEAVIDELWSPFVAAWFEGGRTDPKVRLLRFEPEWAEIWLDDSSLLAGIKMMLGMDPKQEYRDNVATVRFR